MSRLGHPLRPSPRNLWAAPRTHPGCDPTSRIVQAFCEDEEAATLSDGGCNRRCPGCNRRCPGCNRMYPGLRRALLRGRGGDGHGRRGGRVCRRPCVEPHRGAARRKSGSTLNRVAAWSRAVAASTRAVAACMHWIAAWIHRAAASVSYGCSLHCIWLQARRYSLGSCATSRAATGDTRPTYYGSAAPQGSPSASTETTCLLISTYCSPLTYSLLTTHYSPLTTHHYVLTTHHYLLRRTTK